MRQDSLFLCVRISRMQAVGSFFRDKHYNFITPNVCDDMHDRCNPIRNPIAQGDIWLSNNVPMILVSAAYKSGGALFITWDEAATGDGPIGMIVLSQTGWFSSGTTPARLMKRRRATPPNLGEVLPFARFATFGIILISPMQRFRLTRSGVPKLRLKRRPTCYITFRVS